MCTVLYFSRLLMALSYWSNQQAIQEFVAGLYFLVSFPSVSVLALGTMAAHTNLTVFLHMAGVMEGLLYVALLCLLMVGIIVNMTYNCVRSVDTERSVVHI